jgi:hypothetical protein
MTKHQEVIQYDRTSGNSRFLQGLKQNDIIPKNFFAAQHCCKDCDEELMERSIKVGGSGMQQRIHPGLFDPKTEHPRIA